MRKAINSNSSIIAIYGSQVEADTAIKEIQYSGCDMSKLCVTAINTGEFMVIVYGTAEDAAQARRVIESSHLLINDRRQTV